MFKIGDFSKFCRVPVSALRYYADIGLLEPIHIDPFTGYRYYSIDQLPRLNRILALKDLGLSLTQIKAMVEQTVSPDEIRGMLRLKQAELQQIVDEEQARLARVAARLSHLEQEGNMPTHDILLKAYEAQQVLFIREIAPTTDYVGTLLGECAQAMMQQHVEFAGAPFSMYPDMEFTPTDFTVEIGFPVTASAPTQIPLSNQRQMILQELPPVPLAASTLHEGSYDTIENAYTALGRWIQDNHYKIVGTPRETYLRGPQDGTPLTEIMFPVEK